MNHAKPLESHLAEETHSADSVVAAEVPESVNSPPPVNISVEAPDISNCQADLCPQDESNNDTASLGANDVWPHTEEVISPERLSPEFNGPPECESEIETVVHSSDTGSELDQRVPVSGLAEFSSADGRSFRDRSEHSTNLSDNESDCAVGLGTSDTQEKGPHSCGSNSNKDEDTEFELSAHHPVPFDNESGGDVMDASTEELGLHRDDDVIAGNSDQNISSEDGPGGWPVSFTADFDAGLEDSGQPVEFSSDWGVVSEEDPPGGAGGDLDEDFGDFDDFDDASFVAAVPSNAVMTEEKFQVPVC
jgi:hypothetical protein